MADNVIPLSPALSIEQFKETWGDLHLAGDIASKLTCIEVEALADVFRTFGAAESAEAWISAHAEGDECGDMHCRCDNPECIAEREG